MSRQFRWPWPILGHNSEGYVEITLVILFCFVQGLKKKKSVCSCIILTYTDRTIRYTNELCNFSFDFKNTIHERLDSETVLCYFCYCLTATFKVCDSRLCTLSFIHVYLFWWSGPIFKVLKCRILKVETVTIETWSDYCIKLWLCV